MQLTNQARLHNVYFALEKNKITAQKLFVRFFVLTLINSKIKGRIHLKMFYNSFVA